MSPPLYRDWWLAATLTSTAALPTGIGHAANMPSPVGVVTALAPHTPSSDDKHTLHVGSNIASGQRITTRGRGPLHILFVDQSAVTLGSDSELTIHEFTYNPETRQGQIHLELTEGSLRIVGGHITKNNAAVITTPFATVKVEGGISLVSVTPSNTRATFLFGIQMQVRTTNSFQNVTRPGFSVNANNGNQTPPFQLSSQELTSQLGQLDRQSGSPSPSPSPSPTPSPAPSPSPTPSPAPSPSPSPSPAPSPNRPLLSISDRNIVPNLPNQQLAPDRVQVSRDNTTQTNPTLALNTLLNSSSSTIQS